MKEAGATSPGLRPCPSGRQRRGLLSPQRSRSMRARCWTASRTGSSSGCSASQERASDIAVEVWFGVAADVSEWRRSLRSMRGVLPRQTGDATYPTASSHQRHMSSAAVPPVDCARHACLDRARHPMGGRGQGQGGRLPRRPHGLRRPLPRWQQRGPHRDRRGSSAEAAADPLGHPVSPHHVGDRRRGGGRSATPDEGDGLGPRDGGRRVPSRGERQRTHDHAVPPRAREGHGAVPRQERARHHEARHRTGLRRQGGAHRAADPGPLRREDLPPEAGSRAAREEPDPHEDLQPLAARLRPDRRGVHGARRAHPAARGRHGFAALRGAARTAST